MHTGLGTRACLHDGLVNATHASSKAHLPLSRSFALCDTCILLQVEGCIKSDDEAVYVCGREVYNRPCCAGPSCRHDWPVAMRPLDEEKEKALPYDWILLLNRLVWPHSYDPAKHFSSFQAPYLNLVREKLLFKLVDCTSFIS